jgi:1-pyrroline-5-carboxylate dehydrogenase
MWDLAYLTSASPRSKRGCQGEDEVVYMSEKKKITYVTLLADESIHEEYEKALEQVDKELGARHPMHIGGEAVEALQQFEVRTPIDKATVIGTFQAGGKEHARQAIHAAFASFDEWSGLEWRERTRIMRRVADLMDQKKFLLSALVTYEAGKNRYEALAEIGEAIDFFRYYSGVYETEEGFERVTRSEVPGEQCRSILRPYGVWAVISPFNFPIALAAGMCTGALLTGNTVVLKPTSTAPLSGLKLYELFVEGGVPPGVVNVVTGPGRPFGETIVRDPEVAGIAFTGSRAVGMWLQRSFINDQPYPKPFVSEMGSKNPVLVTKHADVPQAVEGVVRAAFGYGGQKCSAASRVYIGEEVFGAFYSLLLQRTDSILVGDPRRKETSFGPVINDEAVKKYTNALSAAKEAGAKVTISGTLADTVPEDDLYVRPAIISGLPRDHFIVKDELFVPILVIEPVRSLNEGIEEANNTEYGLTSGIFSQNEEEVAEYFRRIRFGVCYANRAGGATTGAWPGAQSFGGWRGSGSTGKGVGGPYYLFSFVHEQAQTRVEEP